MLWDAGGETFWVACGGTPGNLMVHAGVPKADESVELTAHAQSVRARPGGAAAAGRGTRGAARRTASRGTRSAASW